MIHVTAHAVVRYQERIANLSDDDVRARLDTPAIRAAIKFGAPYVRLGSGHRVVIANGAVVTVLPVECPAWRLGMRKEIQ